VYGALYRRLGTTYRPHPGRRDHQELALLAVRNHPEDRSHLLLRGGSLKAQKIRCFWSVELCSLMMVVADAKTCRHVASLCKYCFLDRYKCVVLDQFVDYNLVDMHGTSNGVKQE